MTVTDGYASPRDVRLPQPSVGRAAACPLAGGHLILVMRAHLDALDHGDVDCGLDLIEIGPHNHE